VYRVFGSRGGWGIRAARTGRQKKPRGRWCASYGTTGLGGVLRIVLIVLIVLWLAGGIGTFGPRP